MSKSQFNIKISTDLLARVKRQAMMSGKSLTEHITDLVTKSLSENDYFDYSDTTKSLDERLLTVESIVENLRYLSPKLKTFTDSDAINCTKYMRCVFDQEVERRNIADKNIAFNDFFEHVRVYIQTNHSIFDRLKEVMISDNATPWTGNELDDLVCNDKCSCPIRKGLISWTGKKDIPSQQEICDKGDELSTY